MLIGAVGACDPTLCPDRSFQARASLALHNKEPKKALDVMRAHYFAHHGRGPRPLISLRAVAAGGSRCPLEPKSKQTLQTIYPFTMQQLPETL